MANRKLTRGQGFDLPDSMPSLSLSKNPGIKEDNHLKINTNLNISPIQI